MIAQLWQYTKTTELFIFKRFFKMVCELYQKKKQTHRYRELVVTSGKSDGGGARLK